MRSQQTVKSSSYALESPGSVDWSDDVPQEGERGEGGLGGGRGERGEEGEQADCQLHHSI